MNRRSTLKSLGVIAAGIALFPGCSDGLNLVLKEDQALSLTPVQSTWIKAMSQAILPYGDKEIVTLESFPDFVVNMITQTSADKARKSFIDGYNATTSSLKVALNSKTDKISPVDMVNFFESKVAEKPKDDATAEEQVALADSQEFINQLRQLSIYHLTTSQAYMEEVDNYNIIPGTYQGAVAL